MVSGFWKGASRLAACLVSCVVGTASAFADPGHGICIQGTNPKEHDQPIGYIGRNCVENPIDGSTNCDDWEEDSLNHDTPGNIDAIKTVKTWPMQFATEMQLDTWEFWAQIEYDESFDPGVQPRRVKLKLQWRWDDISTSDDCVTFPQYHFRTVDNGLKLYEGCHPDFCY